MGNKISKKEIARRKAEAEKKEARRAKFDYVLPLLAMLAFVWLGGYIFNGTGIKDTPPKKDIVAVEITDLSVSNETKIFTDEENIKNAHAVLGLVRFKHGEIAKEEAVATIIYTMNDETKHVLEVSDNTVTWNNQTYKIVRDSMLRQAIPAFFFPETLPTDK